MRTPTRGEAGLTFGINDAANEARLKELILYVVSKCGTDARFGATKLNKILYFADFSSFARSGRSITGVEYMKLPKGPAPRRLVPLRKQLTETGELKVTSKHLFSGYTQTRFVAMREPRLESFTGEEIALVDEVIEYLRDMTADEVSEHSHGLPWELADDYGAIPYETVFLAHRALRQEDIARAHVLAEQRGWRKAS